jgi:large subunit ribosomal protein L5
VSRLKDYYRETVVKQLQEQFNYKSVMEVPRITKITLNMGVGEALLTKRCWKTQWLTWRKLPVRNPL